MKKPYQVEPFAWGFLTSKNDDLEYRIASGLLRFAEEVPISINPEEWFVGLCGGMPRSMAVTFASNGGIVVHTDRIPKNLAKNPGVALTLSGIYGKMAKWDIRIHTDFKRTFKEERMRTTKVMWAGGSYGGHGNPDYEELLRLGTDGIRDKIADYRQKNRGKEDFYDALRLSLDAIDVLAARYRMLAVDMLKTASPKDAPILKRQIEALSNVPKNTPRSFFEACTFFWLTFGFLEMDSPGLFDYALGRYYENDDKTDRYACLERLWELFHKCRSWNLCISGSDENFNDMSNALTYDVLKVAREKKYNTPNITMRVHRNTPESIWQAAVETLGTGIGMPAIYNDECVCVALEKIGIPPKHSHLYCMNGCNQIDIFGKSHMGLEDGEVCLAKCLEMVLYNGHVTHTPLVLGLRTGNPWDFKSFEEFMAAFKKQVEHVSKTVVKLSNNAQEAYAKYNPNPWRSCLIEGCIEKGIDYKNGGPLYGHGQILTEALPDTADSLAAIKHYIYDEKKYTMRDLVSAMRADFRGYKELHKDFSTYHKFGNDIEDVDEIYKDITHHIYNYFLGQKTFRGGVFGMGCSTFNRSADYGRHIGALPNGKTRKSDLLGDSIGPVPGSDVNGPTAMLNSVNKVDQTLATSGNVLQMKFDKNQFNTPTGMAGFIALAKTYFRRGGQTLQVNVLSKEELLDAQKHPENHKNLVVRVGGFSAYFVNLERGLQDNIIARTENGF